MRWIIVIVLVCGGAQLAAEDLFRSPFAGTWYSKDGEQLRTTLTALLKAAPRAELLSAPNVVLVPHSAYPFAGGVAAAGFRLLEGRSYDRIVILAPNHEGRGRRIAMLDADGYETPLGVQPLDRKAISTLAGDPLFVRDRIPFTTDHGVDLQVPWLRLLAPSAKLVPLLCEGLRLSDLVKVGNGLRKVLGNSTLLVVSSDLTHYGERFGYQPFPGETARQLVTKISELDKEVLRLVVARDLPGLIQHVSASRLTVCGVFPLAVALELVAAEGLSGAVLAYDTSSTTTGDYSTVVGYGAAALTAPWSKAVVETENAEAGEELLRLAKDALRTGLRGSGELRLSRYRLGTRAKSFGGVFVIVFEGELVVDSRGTVAEITPVYQTVLDAINELVRLPGIKELAADEKRYAKTRVGVVLVGEVFRLVTEVELDPRVEGIYLSSRDGIQVLLPFEAVQRQLDAPRFLDALCGKAGLLEKCWRDTGRQVFRFRTQQYLEPLR